MSSIAEMPAVLAACDGCSPTLLSQAARRFRDCEGYLDALVGLVSDPDDRLSRAASWMLKAELESGVRVSAGQTGRLVSALGDVRAWQAQLHVCQSIARLDLSAPASQPLRAWLMPLLESERPFLRAWALDALCHLADSSVDMTSLLERMRADPAASVRARVRNLFKAARRPG